MSQPSSTRNAPVWVTALLAVVAVVLVIVAVVHFVEPAGSLPSFLPGHQKGSTHHHAKHGVAALLVAIAALAGAWLSTGHKRISRAG